MFCYGRYVSYASYASCFLQEHGQGYVIVSYIQDFLNI